MLCALGGALWRQWSFSRHVGKLDEISDTWFLRLFESAKRSMDVSRKIRLLKIETLRTPALFGFFKPRLLIPSSVVNRLSKQELRMVLMHELAHVRRRDVLLNWLIIGVRALHWFNPFVWLAMRQLRAGRELVCDEMVLVRLEPPERLTYGNSLIKLIEDFSRSRFSPSLLRAVSGNLETKRRITMIADFGEKARSVQFLFAAIVVGLCCFTFTRAADKDSNVRSAELPNKESPARVLELKVSAVPAETGVSEHGALVGDLTFVKGARPVTVTGIGLVSGLSGGGGADAPEVRTKLAETLQRFRISIPPERLISRNIALVLVSADLDFNAKSGDRFDLEVGVMGEARTLKGGALIQTFLYGVDGSVVAVGQGPIEVLDAVPQGQRNLVNGIDLGLPGTSLVKGGGIIEKSPVSIFFRNGKSIDLQLNTVEDGMATRIAEAINQTFRDCARAVAPQTIRINLPEKYRTLPARFLEEINKIEVSEFVIQ